MGIFAPTPLDRRPRMFSGIVLSIDFADPPTSQHRASGLAFLWIVWQNWRCLKKRLVQVPVRDLLLDRETTEMYLALRIYLSNGLNPAV